MSSGSIGLSKEVNAYLEQVGVREPEVLRRLREETAMMPEARMQIAVEEGALLSLLVQLLSAQRILEVGTFTGYSSTAMGLALPAGGRIVCCDISKEYTDVARRGWSEAGIADRVELRLGPAIDTLDALLEEGSAGTFDLAFIDADKGNYAGYYERALRLVRSGGLIAIDNVLWSGRVADPADTDEETVAIRNLNAAIATDQRVDVAMIPIADGVTLARVR
ncbi:MAG: class I SAM-dependent methyltransferase [Chloroflexota bacterium]|nr:class I SAM-dependent methyltransferase [Chloroflexota bacterium]